MRKEERIRKEQKEHRLDYLWTLKEFSSPFIAFFGIGLPFFIYADYKIKKEENKKLTFHDYVFHS